MKTGVAVRQASIRGPLAVLSMLVGFGVGCSSPNRSGTASATPEHAAPTSSEGPSESGATKLTPPPPPTIPVLSGDKLATNDVKLRGFFPVDGALMVIAGKNKVGRITSERVEWIEKPLPAPSPALGARVIRGVVGRWPDDIGVMIEWENPRSPAPTYYPFTGKGMAATAAEGGGWGYVKGPALIGDSTIVDIADLFEGTRLVTVRGKTTRKHTSASAAGCKLKETLPKDVAEQDAAIQPQAFAATRAGTLVSVGQLCDEHGAYASAESLGHRRQTAHRRSGE